MLVTNCRWRPPPLPRTAAWLTTRTDRLPRNDTTFSLTRTIPASLSFDTLLLYRLSQDRIPGWCDSISGFRAQGLLLNYLVSSMNGWICATHLNSCCRAGNWLLAVEARGLPLPPLPGRPERPDDACCNPEPFQPSGAPRMTGSMVSELPNAKLRRPAHRHQPLQFRAQQTECLLLACEARRAAL